MPGRNVTNARVCYVLKASSGRAFFSIKHIKAKQCRPAKVSGNRSSSRAKRRNRAAQAKVRSTTQRRGSKTKPRLASGSLTTSRRIPHLSRPSGGLAGIALIHVREFNVMEGHLLEGLSQDLHLRPVLDIRRCHGEGQPVTQGIDGDMALRSLPTLGPVVAGPRPTFRSGWQGAAIQNGGGGRIGPARGQAQHLAQIVDHGLEAAGFQPALGLLIDDLPRGQIMRQPAPRRTAPNQPAQAIEGFAQVVMALRDGLAHHVRYDATKAHSSSETSLG